MTLLLPRLSDDYTLVLVTGEVLAVALEAAALALADPRRDRARALVASALANALSFGASQIFGGG